MDERRSSRTIRNSLSQAESSTVWIVFIAILVMHLRDLAGGVRINTMTVEAKALKLASDP